jgi:type IV secretory pathway component VirB8
MSPIDENIPRREFKKRRSRLIFSLRRKRDLAWLLLSTVPLLVAVTLLVFHVKLRKPALIQPPAVSPQK